LTGQGVYPRPVQNPLPIWLRVGGSPESFIRAGVLGLPLMVAIIGGYPERFRALIDLYRRDPRGNYSCAELLNLHAARSDDTITKTEPFASDHARG
jgi:alkanesulfonate monooxygenase SsuD/methylene tetrahydromethanopterin reductase-like flavin-dependent oxidoreductase (luciferase family)